MTRFRSLAVGAAIACGALLTACVAGRAHRVPGSDLALPAGSYSDQLLAALLAQCEVTRIPTSTAADDAKSDACTRGDSARRDPGTVARGPTRVP